MSADAGSQGSKQLSLVHGKPLESEPGLGALTIPGYFREVTQRYSEREALVHRTAEGVVRWSYQELWDRAFEVSRALIACGVGKDSRVGVLMTNRPEFLATMFGVGLAGGVTVALNTFSTPHELDYLLNASGVSILLFERNIAGKDFGAILGDLEPALKTDAPGAVLSEKFPFLRRGVVVDAPGAAPLGGAIESWDDFLKHGASVPPGVVDAASAATKPADLGVLFFSSGTTSLPKGILHSHRAVAVQWWRMPHLFNTHGDVRIWTANGFFWSGNFTLVVGNALSSGGSMVLQSVFKPDESVALMMAEGVTYPIASPHQWARMQDAPNYESADFSKLRYIDWRYPIASHPTVKTDWNLPISYGATETLAINCSTRASGDEADLRKDLRKDCYGAPLAGNTLKVIDPETGAIVPRGERGEFAIKGATLMMGYLGKTLEECFDPEGYYRTGDGGFVDEAGRMFFEGRLSDIIKTGGANVSPLEIDAVIREYPGVKVAQTIGLPDPLLGEMVVSCIVAHEGATLEEGAVRDFLKERLASFKVPKKIFFLAEDEISMTGSNKVKAGLLRELVAKKLSAD